MRDEISIFVIDPCNFVAVGLEENFKQCHQTLFRMLGSETNAERGVTAAISLQPDVIIFEINTPDSDGLDVIQRLNQHCPDTIIFVLTEINIRLLEKLALVSGASFYACKNKGMSLIPQLILEAFE